MPSFSDPVIAPAFIGGYLAVNPFAVVFYVGNTTNPGEDQGSPGPTPRAQGRSPKNPFTTIAAALAQTVNGRGDLVVIQRGTYTENLTISTAGTTLISADPYGHGHVTIIGRTVVTASYVSAYGIDFFSNSASLASLRLGAFTDPTDTVNGCWFERCAFVSNGTTKPGFGALLFGTGSPMFKDCQFIDNGRGLAIHSNTGGKVSDAQILNCLFMENTSYDLGTGSGVAAVDGYGTQGADDGTQNILIADCAFAGGPTLPTRFVDIAGVSSGTMTRCSIANPTNASAQIRIPGGIEYVANATRAGWTTGVPA